MPRGVLWFIFNLRIKIGVSQTRSFPSPRGIGRLTASHQWLGLAVFSLACPDLAADRHPNSNTFKSHRYTSQLKQCKVQWYCTETDTYIHNFFTFLHLTQAQWYLRLYIHTLSKFHTGYLKGLLGPHSSVGHNRM
jgi:hypothetical protein